MQESQDDVRIEYIPPATEQVEAYSQQVCAELGDEFTQPEIGMVQVRLTKALP